MNDKLHPALAEHAMEAELQLERERHRKTWRQLEQARGLLRMATDRWESWASEIIHTTPEYESELAEIARVRAALSQQAEPVCRCTMSQRVLGDGCWVCNPELAAELAAEVEDDEPAPVQDEREAFEAYMLDREHPVIGWIWTDWFKRGDDADTYADDYVQGAWVIWQARPAQTEQPIRLPELEDENTQLRAQIAEANADFVRIANEREALRAELDAIRESQLSPELLQALLQGLATAENFFGHTLELKKDGELVAVVDVTAVKPGKQTPAEQLDALKAQRGEAVTHVSEETFSSDGTSDIITCNLPIGTALYTALPATDALVEALEEFSGLLQLAADALSDLYSGTRIEADIRHALETHRASQRKER